MQIKIFSLDSRGQPAVVQCIFEILPLDGGRLTMNTTLLLAPMFLGIDSK